MKTVALICNVVLWLFFGMVVVTDGLPTGTDIPMALITFLMPILNVMVIHVLSSPSRIVKFVTLASNILWLLLVVWLIVTRYPSHPKEEGLIAYIVVMAATPLISAAAIYFGLRSVKS